MHTRPSPQIVPGLVASLTALAVALFGVLPANAQSTAQLLEKGIYTEQTVGDLDAAIEIYSKIVSDAGAQRPHLAEAQLRLGTCLAKQGQVARAQATFERLIREYPEQEAMVARAREQLTAAEPSLPLGPTPWQHGELLEYEIRIPTGSTIGILQLTAAETEENGLPAWRLVQRKFVFAAANNHGVSEVVVERDSQRPLSSTFRHGVLGNAFATYGPGGVEITGGEKDTQLPLSHQVFDNEQAMHLLRLLPQEQGSKTSLHLLPTYVAAVIPVEVEVGAQEICQVPAGEFPCVSMSLKAGQENHSLWISTGPERYLLRQDAGGAMIELSKIGQRDPGEQIPFQLEGFSLAGKLPAGWMHYDHRNPDRPTKATLRLLDSRFETLSTIEVDRCPPGRCPPLQQTAERELEGAKERFAGYQLRDDSLTQREIAGHPGIAFAGDYQRDDEPWVQYRLYTITDELRIEIIFRVPREHFETLRKELEGIVGSLFIESAQGSAS